MPASYRIQIHDDGPHKYRTTGAASISASRNPMRDAAASLLGHGATPDALLSGSFDGAGISPVALARLVAPYRAPRTDHRSPSTLRNVD